jgi:hypothetical protein
LIVVPAALDVQWQDEMRDNPLFTAGDLIYDGVIIREIPELPTIPDVGAGGTVDAGADRRTKTKPETDRRGNRQQGHGQDYEIRS